MHQHHVQFGQLRCHVLQADTAPPRRMAMLCHGYGADGHDLVAIAGYLGTALGTAADGTAFVFPEAVLDLADSGMHGRAWWPIDMAGLTTPGAAAARLDAMRCSPPAGMQLARRRLREAIEAALQHFGLNYSQFILGGFSQGAMLACDVALRLEEPPAALALLSACLVDEPTVRRLAPSRRGLPVLQSHGRNDPILPFAQAESLRDILQAAGLAVTFQAFDGGHTISQETLVHLTHLLRQDS
jgi:phospholipase/carboxylesterase